MVCNKNANVFIFKPRNNGLNIFYRNGIYTCEGFIKQYKFWINGKRSCYFGPPPLTTTKTISVVSPYVREMKFVQQRFYFHFAFFLRHLRHFEHRHYIVFHGKFSKYAGFLRQVSYTHLRTFI